MVIVAVHLTFPLTLSAAKAKGDGLSFPTSLAHCCKCHNLLTSRTATHIFREAHPAATLMETHMHIAVSDMLLQKGRIDTDEKRKGQLKH